MCRARRSIHVRPRPVSPEFQQALQASVLVTLGRRNLPNASALVDTAKADLKRDTTGLPGMRPYALEGGEAVLNLIQSQLGRLGVLPERKDM